MSDLIHQVRIIFGDTDAMGVVYYANYLRYFESARLAFLRARGLSARQWAERGIQFPVTEASCRYRRPARYEDLIDVHITMRDLAFASLRFEYAVRRDGELLAEGHTVHACVDPSGRPRRIPADLRAILAAREPASGQAIS